MRILIAEDDTTSRRLLAKLLTKWGHDVVSVSDGEAAWQQLQHANPPQLAILDWMMPGRDGVQIIRDVRARPQGPYIYTILLTARSERQDLLDAMEAGTDDYITKPYDSAELEARIRAGIRILDLQAELVNAQETLQRQATHDPLTGLPNRLLFRDRLTQKLLEARRGREILGVMFVDLDRFKAINDTLGHGVGDELLVVVAERLKSALREEDTFARIGGDEFTVIVGGLSSAEELTSVARRMLSAMEAPFCISGHEFSMSASVGISVYPIDGDDVEQLVRNADTAMYRAKDSKDDKHQFYSGKASSPSLDREALATDLKNGIGCGELELYYQPRVDLKSGQILSAEALIRWRHPRHGLMLPTEFIPLAEESGSIIDLGQWVLTNACAHSRSWQVSGLRSVEIAVNLSGKQLQRGDLTNLVKRALRQTGLAPELLSLEISESSLADCNEDSAQCLREIARLGVGLSLDQFGTGNYWLGNLKRVPISTVKVDRSFVHDITNDSNDAAIAGAIVAMAKSLKLKTIAEGVETWEQLDFLKSLGCDQMQGYFISRPVPEAEFQRLLGSGDSRGQAA